MSLKAKIAKIIEKAVQDASVEQGKGAEYYAGRIIALLPKTK